MIVRRTDAGFTLFEQRGEKLVKRGEIRPIDGKPAAYSLKFGRAPVHIFDFAAGIPGFSLAGLQKALKIDLKAADGVVIHVHRSGTAVYLTPTKSRMTYACH